MIILFLSILQVICSDLTESKGWQWPSPLYAGLQLFTLQSVVLALTDQRVDYFLILRQQICVFRRMNLLVKISQLLPETVGGEHIVTYSNEPISEILSASYPKSIFLESNMQPESMLMVWDSEWKRRWQFYEHLMTLPVLWGTIQCFNFSGQFLKTYYTMSIWRDMPPHAPCI